MKSVSMTRSQGQMYSVGNYLMTGKVLGKGHFARVEEATHRIIRKKVAIKIIDLTCIKEDYARRNLHREPRVMARLRHPCIAALYETMMHGPRLYVVMEAACGGDLCAHVLGSRGACGLRGLPEARARSLAAQLVSAVRHMHARGVVHRDLKMENIMLDTSKQFIKIVDFGLSNVWCCGSGLQTPCGSLEYAAPELFRDGHRYGPEVDLWSIGVIVFGMVTGGLPFTGGSESCGPGGGCGEGGRSRPQLRAAITKGFTRKQRNALHATSTECKTFIQHLLEPNVDLRMKIEEAARHRWLRRPGLRMKTHPLADADHKLNREIFRQISEVTGKVPSDVAAQVKADPFGSVAGIYNIKVHHHQMQAIPGTDLLWCSIAQDPPPPTPPEYNHKSEKSEAIPIPTNQTKTPNEIYQSNFQNTYSDKLQTYGNLNSTSSYTRTTKATPMNGVNGSQQKTTTNQISPTKTTPYSTEKRDMKTTPILNKTTTNGVASKAIVNAIRAKLNVATTARLSIPNRPLSGSVAKKQEVRSQDNGDCPPRLACIEEHSITSMMANPELNRLGRINRGVAKIPFSKQLNERHAVDISKTSEGKRIEFYRKGGDGLPSWKASGSIPVTPARILLQTNATAIKRASLGNIVSPHSSTNSHCKSDRTPIFRQISEVTGKVPSDVAAQVKADPFGSVAGIYNIKVHHHQMQAIPGTDLLWCSIAQDPPPPTPPEYNHKSEKSEAIPIPTNQTKTPNEIYQSNFQNTYSDKLQTYGNLNSTSSYTRTTKATPMNGVNGSQQKTTTNQISPTKTTPYSTEKRDMKTTPILNKTTTNGVASKAIVNAIRAKLNVATTARLSIPNRPLSGSVAKKQEVRSQDNGDCPPRLACIEEHSITSMMANPELNRLGRINRGVAKIPFSKQLNERHAVDISKTSEGKRIEFYRKGGDGLPSWKASGSIPVTPARILLQTNATAIKRASLGNIVSPHSSTNSHCKSDRTPIGWYASSLGKSPGPLQRFRKTAM